MKKQKIVACSAILLLFFGIGLGYSLNKNANSDEPKTNENRKVRNIDEKEYEDEKIYIITGDYEGEYQLEYVNLLSAETAPNETGYRWSRSLVSDFNTTDCYSYEDYKDYMEEYGLKPKYSDKNKYYFIIAQANEGSANVEVRLADVLVKKKMINVFMYEKFSGYTADIAGYVLVIPLSKEVNDYTVTTTYTKEEYQNLKKYGRVEDPRYFVEDKPMIYIYPEKEMEVNVKLGNPDVLTTTYPKYKDGWKVIASPDGTLKYNGREYYGLFWEGTDHDVSIKEDGFIVKGEDVESFLEEKLAILGLNEKEANEFIVFWLPRMEHNKYNYIRFETRDEMNSYMPLIVTPTPDSVIRVVMDFKGLDEKIDVKEQKLETPSRTGYTVVEWGGSEMR
jgi:hypothetical protein